TMRPFFIIWIGQAISILGSELVRFALIWWLTKETGSATVLATASIVGILPRLVLSPFSGALIDRLNRRRVMIIADSMIALTVAVLAVFFMLDIVHYWHIYVFTFLSAVGGIFHQPAMLASTSLMVPKKHLSRISGLNHTLSGTLHILAPPLGALLLELLPLQSILAIDIVSAAIAITTLFFIAIPQPRKVEGTTSPPISLPLLWTDVRAGMRFLLSWSGLFLMVIVYTLVHLFFTPAMTIMPILVKDYFMGDALQLGWLQSGAGIGLVAGGVILGAWGGHKRRIITSMLGMTMIGVSLSLIGWAPPNAIWLAIGGMLLMGFSLTFVTGLRMAIWQAVIPPEIQGRVFTLMTAIMAILDIVGLAIVGPVTDNIGPQTWYIISGIAIFLLGFSTFFIPAIMRVEDQKAASLVLAGDG
ncbi:MAG: MFS transporter, partial [Anaerolineaceae bacterium]|nr:MFS transporter [Anaerolineaceae bacterium]